MASRTKVYGFTTTASGGWKVPAGKQVRVIVRATSRQKVVDACRIAGMNNVTVGFLTSYAATTGNVTELESAVLNRVAYQAYDYPRSPFWYLLPEKEEES
jgi:hypothetical protein